MPNVFTTKSTTNHIGWFNLADFHKANPFHIKDQIINKIKSGKAIPKIAANDDVSTAAIF